MKDNKMSKQTATHAQKGPGLNTPRNGPKRSTDIKNFDNGVGARSQVTKND